MKGESRGDFSRDTFDPARHFLRVLMQQGRVSLDADWNEQTDILLYYLQTLARDLIGPFAGPEDPAERGFGITAADAPSKSFNISRGRYYVDGILCENMQGGSSCKSEGSEEIDYYNQPDFPRDANKSDFQPDDLPLLVYLDVWERHISYIEDDYIREKALGVADTASRSRVVWQVKALKGDNWKSILGKKQYTCEAIRANWSGIAETLLQNPNRGFLKAFAKETNEVSTDPCVISPESRYRGEENQLYRVEIHRGGPAREEGGSNESVAATFKWSRDNGTVAFPIISKSGNIVVLEHLGRDDRLGLKKGDWVEVIDDNYALLIQSRPSPLTTPDIRPLIQIGSVDSTEMSVTLKLQDSSDIPDYPEDSPKHPLLRRWDHKKGDPTEQDEPTMMEHDGVLYVEENKRLTLEDGIQIWFEGSESKIQNYQRGDYWLIPARTATGDVEWPDDPDNPGSKLLLPPHGIDHHYAPLAVVVEDKGSWKCGGEYDCRCWIRKSMIAPCGSDSEKKYQ